MTLPREDVYATLLLNDLYLPGATVLAHSLRDAGTSKKLAVFFNPESVSFNALKELRILFNYVIPVERIRNEFPANLELMNRPDLHSTFTKIVLWNQLQFRKIVYLDSDMVALRAPDELFDLPDAFSAAPDIGWPDIFNSGLMVLTPNETDYNALLSMAQQGISFDGADQGLLNMYFGSNFNRLSFTYNVIPSASYQYIPAYRYFQSQIVMLHFIGQNKPWLQGNYTNSDCSPLDEMSKIWWTVHDRHYDKQSKNIECLIDEINMKNIVEEQSLHKLENFISPPSTTPLHQEDVETQYEIESVQPESVFIDQESVDKTFETVIEEIDLDQSKNSEDIESLQEDNLISWDASKEPPPIDSKPEALNFPTTQYAMSSDPRLFRPPDRYPDPPKHVKIEVPRNPEHQKLKPIFPWEISAEKPSRVFAEDYDELVTYHNLEESTESQDKFLEDKSVMTVPFSRPVPRDYWQMLPLGNAWDSIPEIEQYVGNLQRRNQRRKSVLRDKLDTNFRDSGLDLFNTSYRIERPTLPVTPAPIRRSNFWGEDKYVNQLPTAKGVPSQEEWDPKKAIEQLEYHQLEIMTQNLEEANALVRETSSRSLLFGSEINSNTAL